MHLCRCGENRLGVRATCIFSFIKISAVLGGLAPKYPR